MKKSYYLSSTFNEVIFKGRNQAYGAYVLRKTYSRNVILAAILATSAFSGALFGPVVSDMIFGEQVKYEKPVYDIGTPIDIPPPPVIEPQKTTAAPVAQKSEKVKTTAFKKQTIVADDTPIAETPIPDQSDLSKVNIGAASIDGAFPDVPGTTLPEPSPTSTDSGAAETITAPFINVEIMPEYRGGTNEMFRFLGKNLIYPAAAQRAGVEGMVIVTFVVSATGQIEDATVLKGLGYGTEEEALRVIKKMPDWTPGRQNGKNVPVRYTMPIRFHLN